ncbi:MAG TPA: MerR family transcriptional regulator [bacterium]|nr:MerR family transcriptional regulator [bacterium]
MSGIEEASSPPGTNGVERPEAVADAPASYRMEEIVRRTGLTPRAIRYYEEMGLLSPSGRTAGGFRLFTDTEIAQLLRIKELQTLLGFSLAEIKETLQADAARAELRQAYEQATDPATRLGLVQQATSLAQTRVRIINERMARLAKLHEEVEQSLARLSTRHEQLLRELAEHQSDDDPDARGHAREKS